MAHAEREKRSIEQIEEQTTAVLRKNDQLMEKWIELYRQRRNAAFSKQKDAVKERAISRS